MKKIINLSIIAPSKKPLANHVFARGFLLGLTNAIVYSIPS